jgi:hypothetical protein
MKRKRRGPACNFPAVVNGRRIGSLRAGVDKGTLQGDLIKKIIKSAKTASYNFFSGVYYTLIGQESDFSL